LEETFWKGGVCVCSLRARVCMIEIIINVTPIWFLGWQGEEDGGLQQKLSFWYVGVIILGLNSILEHYYEFCALIWT
jgi:hypothetical protein